MNNAEMKPTLWFYVIHCSNPEMIHILEEYHLPTIFHGSYSNTLKAAIQFHNRNIIEYILINVIKEKDLFQESSNNYDNRFNYCFHYCSYYFFPVEIADIKNHNYFFYYSCQYDYYNLVVLFIQTKEMNLNDKIEMNFV